MAHSMFVRRSVAVLASTAATAALALIPAGGAHASVKAVYVGGGNASADVVEGGTNTCDLTSAPGSDDVTTSQTTFTHGTKHKSAALNATFTNSENASDQVTVKGHITSSLTLKKKNNDLSDFDLKGSGSLTIDHTVLPSGCQASGLVGAGVQEVDFTEHKKGWFTLTRDTKKPNSFTEFVLVNLKNNQAVTLEFFEGPQSHATTRALLKPGKYAIAETEVAVTAGGSGIGFKNAQRSSKVKATLELHGVFTPLKKKHHH